MLPIALFYDDDAYRETLRVSQPSHADGPHGLMGRQVAGRAFLDAYLGHGTWDELVAVLRRRECRDTLVRFCQDHPSSRAKARRLRFVDEARFLEEFAADPPGSPLYMPCPPDPRHAWARAHAGPGRFAISGVTHTLCSQGAVEHLQHLVTAPYEPYDALICTSTAVEAMVRAVTGAYCDYLRDRFGGSPALRPRLAVIPLGVDTEQYRPATAAERAEARLAYGVADDEVAVLFVGRLSHHAKAHPFPLFRGASLAARATGRKVHLVLAGWAANAAILNAFREGARQLAEGVRVTFVDGTEPAHRMRVWRAADIFASPSDNIQETFGLSVVEAMACGLPVVASDWDGYRDLVADGECGLLVPTYLVRDATADATARLIVGEVNYDYFLAECSQASAIDVEAMGAALGRLAADDALRARMGAAGRERALGRFAWRHVVLAYEALWEEQEAERRARLTHAGAPARGRVGPAAYPAPEHSFAGYPSRLLEADDRVVAAETAADELECFLALPLSNHAADRRCADAAVLGALLREARTPRTLAEIDACFARAGVDRLKGRATIAWMLKYGLMRALV